jgi:hypothetical protein
MNFPVWVDPCSAPAFALDDGSSESNDSDIEPQSPPTPIADDGDVILQVSSGSHFEHYLVCSQVLCTTSKVFKRMLGKDSSFAEAVALRQARFTDDEIPITIRLDDDPWAMGAVLRVLHARHYTVPRKITLPQMVQIAVICDKYIFHEGLYTTSAIWILPLRSEDSIRDFPEDWLLISWVFGLRDIFGAASKTLILGAMVANERLVFGVEKRTLPENIPCSVSSKPAYRFILVRL